MKKTLSRFLAIALPVAFVLAAPTWLQSCDNSEPTEPTSDDNGDDFRIGTQSAREYYEGFLYKEIADKLGIGFETVHTHVRNIYDKLHVRSRTGAEDTESKFFLGIGHAHYLSGCRASGN